MRLESGTLMQVRGWQGNRRHQRGMKSTCGLSIANHDELACEKSNIKMAIEKISPGRGVPGG